MKWILNTWQKVRTRTAIIFFTLSFGLILFGFYVLAHDFLSIAHPPPPSAPITEQEAYWRERIHTLGGSAAYEEFISSVKGYGFNSQHFLGHIFGDALYTEVGLDGMQVCDWHLFGGCMHQLMSREVMDHGIASIAALDRSCKGIVSCEHGIGHGIVSALGYTFPDLKKTLALCHTLSHDTPIFGCAGGASMEYNLRRLLGDTSFTVRPLGNDWFDPCDRFSGDDARSCYYWQPTWWTLFIPEQESAFEPAFKHMADLCDSLSDKTYRYACVAGTSFGVTLKRSPEQAVHLCDSMYVDANELLLCRVNVGLALKTMLIQDPGSACEGLPAKALAYCRAEVGKEGRQLPLVSPADLQSR